MRYFAPALIISMPLLLMALTSYQTEPFYNNDETRHVATGVFFADFIADLPLQHPRDYAIDWYLRYPALGLLSWPPLFHILEGVSMSLFGPSYSVARGLILVFAIGGLLQVYRWALLYRSRVSSLAIALFVALSPLYAEISRVVMLEIPCFFFAISSILYFERYLIQRRRANALWCGVFAAAAALTRFDAFFLILYFIFRLIPRQHRSCIRQPAVLGSIALALVLTLPYYIMTLLLYGSAAAHAASAGTSAESSAFPSWGNLLDHPRSLSHSIGWPMLLFATIGLVIVIMKQKPGRGMVLALIGAVYFGFSPLAEREPRYVIYWLPAWAWLACYAVQFIAKLQPRRWLSVAMLLALFLATVSITLPRPAYYVHGYRYAAEWVMAQPEQSPVILVDAYLNGDFIYQTCVLDRSRNRQVLRGDKLLYGMVSDPHGGYADHATTETEVLELLQRFDPEYLVIEEPQVRFILPGATLLRTTLHNHPERFQLVKSIPVDTNHPTFQGVYLEIWQQTVRNPSREPLNRLQMLNLGRSLERKPAP